MGGRGLTDGDEEGEVYGQGFIVGRFSDVEWWTCLFARWEIKKKNGAREASEIS